MPLDHIWLLGMLYNCPICDVSWHVSIIGSFTKKILIPEKACIQTFWSASLQRKFL